MTTPSNPYGNDGQNNNDNFGQGNNDNFGQGSAYPYGGASDNTGFDATAGSNAGGYPGGGYPGGMNAGMPMGGEQPNNLMPWSIINTILSICACCLPIGLIGVYFSSQVKKKWEMGDQAGALQTAKTTRTTNIVISCIVVAMFLLSILGQVMGWAPDYEQLMNEYQ
ncbi:Interferon-induced transmembrane protein [Corynebacterium kalinowskii]|uniref:Interferon-induced transmembrane protein n=1 Tax=Corynebacterium kalinowskii TaxID=2675216 RepID=A0A6B8VCM6_9CORY|nr:CD225/dispanin family protein [Corynebacterium kalinowskii]QGU02912.1 Interferon-induced transmembrane protein [Corynebacterium kalinowskii]